MPPTITRVEKLSWVMSLKRRIRIGRVMRVIRFSRMSKVMRKTSYAFFKLSG